MTMGSEMVEGGGGAAEQGGAAAAEQHGLQFFCCADWRVGLETTSLDLQGTSLQPDDVALIGTAVIIIACSPTMWPS
jgi:hypothetical protein